MLSLVKFRKWIFVTSLLSALGKGGGLHLPLLQGCFVSSLVEIGSVVLEKIFKFRNCIFIMP